MRIVLEPQFYRSLNVGDHAMCFVAAKRLRELWPEAGIHVVTDQPELFESLNQGVEPHATAGRKSWLYGRLADRVGSRLGDRTGAALFTLERRLRTRFPHPIMKAIELERRALRRSQPAAQGFVELIEGADLVAVSGGGSFTDAFARSTLAVLEVAALAKRAGVPVAMMGQAFGPATDTALLAAGRDVLPSLDQIGVRESEESLRLLVELGVDPNRVVVTGDDALEPAFAARREAIDQEGIGVNLRVAGYAGVVSADAERLGKEIVGIARRLSQPLIPVPISAYAGESDAETIARMLGEEVDGVAPVRSVEDAIDRVSSCRVVVTGSYHGAVFALAQGIPAVCVAASTYYLHKFAGLKAHFGRGCVPVRFGSLGPTGLGEAVERLWEEAEQLRPELLESAARQIDAGRAAYRRLLELVP